MLATAKPYIGRRVASKEVKFETHKNKKHRNPEIFAIVENKHLYKHLPCKNLKNELAFLRDTKDKQELYRTNIFRQLYRENSCGQIL